ncbi:TPA: host specificity protein J [Haemophilus influenzae]
MGKGRGGGGHTPVEAKESGRSKQLVKIVEVISEGEVYGLADGMKSIYFDKTPVQNKDGSYNFKNVQVEGRVGGQVQDLMAGFNTSEKEVGVGTLVKKNLPLTRTVTDSKVSRLRLTIGVQSLFKQEDNGDTNGTSVNFVITIGSRTYPVSISGKYSSQYLQHHTFDNLPSVPFIVKVERTTDDSTTQRLQNNTIWSSYTEIIDTEFAYPNTALMGVKFDSEYFSNIPTRTYDLLGLKVKVPSNYDTRTRQYTGMWDGTFKVDWTDNPAWVLYDVVTNKRYGLGGRLGEFGADKWALYQVAQYCDQLVPDGFGGQEPRFTCNVWLTEQRSAYQVINDICSIFRAMPVWNGQQLTVVMDRPADPVWTYTNANVDESGFSYTFSARKSRHNAIQVEYADKENSYEKAIEYVADDESIRKNGLNVKKITAFGCTSRGQAHRTALWLLQTEKLETKTVTFTVGAEGLMHIPGDIIKVADTHYAGTNIGGRVLAVNGMTVTLDREITISGNSYLSYINANAKHQNIKIISVNGAEVTLDQPPLGLEIYGVWSLTTQQVTSQLFKALSVKEESKGKYTIMALQHEPQKEAIVDNGAKFEPVGTTVLTTPQISNIGVAVNADGSVSVDSSVTGGNGIVKYDIRIYKGGVLYDVRLGQPSPNLNIDSLENGDYSVLIQVKNENGQLLSEKTQTFTINKPPAPTGVRTTGGLGNITLEWDWVDDATATEIFTSETDDIKTAKRLTKVAARTYTHEVGAKQVRYYWLRHARGVNVGPFNQQSGIKGESAVNIDAELEVLNKKLSQNIVNEVIDTALPARKLGMTKYVDSLDVNVYQGQKQVYDESSNKTYTWNGTKYVPVETELLASKIKGIIQPSQLAPIPTANLAGKLTDAQIEQISATKLVGNINIAQIPSIPTNKLTGLLTDAQLQNISATKITGTLDISKVPAIPTTKLSGTIGASQITANSIGTNHLGANAVTAEKILSGAITSDKITSNAITADKIASNAITTNKIDANAITAQKIAGNAIESNHIKAGSIIAGKLGANAVTADNIATNAITATKIMGGAITAEKLSANSVGANAIQSGAITTDKLGANSVDAGKIRAGAINANHIQAGQISTDKLAIGLGGNLLYNPIFDNKAYGWSENRGNGSLARQTTRLIRRTSTKFNGLVTNGAVLIAEVWANSGVSSWWNIAEQVVSVVPNQRYCLSAFIDAWQCTGELIVQEIASDGVSWVRNFAFSERKGRNIPGYSQSGAMEENVGSVNPLTRNHVFFTAPSSGYVSVVCVMRNIQSGATLKIANPMLEECTEHTTEPSPWQNAGVTAIHGGSIVTNSITTQQMAANSITANEIAAGAVMAKHVAANSIGANHVATRSLTADKLNVTSISSISADLGTINGGSLKIGSLNGNFGTLFEVQSNGGFRLVSRDASGGIELSSFTRALHVWNGGTEAIRVGKL